MITRLPGFSRTRSRLVKHRGIVHIVAVASDTKCGMLDQARQALEAATASLVEVGGRKSDILTVTCYLSEIAQKEDFNTAWDEWADTENPPLRACLGTQNIGGHLVELVLMAALNSDH